MRHKPLGYKHISQRIALLDRFVTEYKATTYISQTVHAANRYGL